MSNGNAGAFPFQHYTRPDGDIHWGEQGLTKHELAAFMALQGLLSNPCGPIQANGCTGWGLTNVTHEQVAGVAARFADAMVAEIANVPDYHRALTDLVALVDRMHANSEGRWPEPDTNCAVCEQGCTPATGTCAYHAAKRLLAVKS